jgi:carboxyl-terminal processing protease
MLLALVVFSLNCYGLASKPKRVEILKGQAPPDNQVGEETQAGVEAPEPDSPEYTTVKAVCELICQGDFEAVEELTKGVAIEQNASLADLLKITAEYRAISQSREAAKESVYEKHLAELAELRTAAESNDVSDVNDITKALSVIALVKEYADEKQKEQLLSDTYVEGIFEAAKEKAAEFESEGKWLDAYLVCYSWLEAILPENQEYSDYADQLVEKSSIVASFQDSPCETQQQRYEKVEKSMFIRAIEALNFNYVNLIDYREVTSKAIERCMLLSEVVGSSSVVREALWEKDANGAAVPDAEYDRKAGAWRVALETILGEVRQSIVGFSKKEFLAVFEKVLDLNATTIELPQTVLVAQFADAALSSLDPYTVMVWPRQVEDFEKTITNEFTGIGIEISKQKGLLTVSSLLPDTPAYNSGLDAGDVIVEVDNTPTKDMSLMCAVRTITGPADTKVTLTIKRSGLDETFEIPIIRARITVPTIRGWQRTETGKWLYMIDEAAKIGYLRITSFSGSTEADLEEVLDKLEAEGLKGLILDLRFNTGGLLDSAVAVTDKFIKEGAIVRTQSLGMPSYAYAHKKGTHPNYPLVILINRRSASASEIVAGALQDKAHKRAVLVGERTHGKGSVQVITPYPNGGARLRYTAAYYHLPSGQRVESQEAMKKQGRDDWGVGPDIEIKLRTDEYKKMLDVQRENDVLVKADHDVGVAPLKKHTVEETLAADAQLAAGILVIRSKLIQAQARSAKLETAKL